MLSLVERFNQSEVDLYSYTPNKGENLAALVVFASAWVAHATLGAFYRQWWFGISMVIACGLETAGYIARTLSASDPHGMNNYLVQIICLTLAPAFMMAGIYFLLAESVVIWGIQYSRVSPWSYSRTFISMDFVAIVLQGMFSFFRIFIVRIAVLT